MSLRILYFEPNERDIERTPNVHKMSIELNALPSLVHHDKDENKRKKNHSEKFDIRMPKDLWKGILNVGESDIVHLSQIH